MRKQIGNILRQLIALQIVIWSKHVKRLIRIFLAKRNLSLGSFRKEFITQANAFYRYFNAKMFLGNISKKLIEQVSKLDEFFFW